MAEHGREHQRGRLNELAATAICGNDITSSCLYVSAFAIIAAGKWAPVSLLMVAAVLFLYRKIYAEVVGALPLNGGAYNALLNTTSKFRASIAACLTILSYMATAVISATEAMHYVANLVPRTTMVWVDGLSPGTAVIGATIGLLAVFMGMTILGINKSSRVAIAIFITHLLSLGLLLIVGLVHVIAHGTDILVANLHNVMLYVRRNEHSNRVKVVTVARDPQKVPARLEKDLKFLDNAYPEINIEFVVVEGSFGPKLIRKLAETWRVPVNLMFIGSPTGQLRYDLAELGGVRMII